MKSKPHILVAIVTFLFLTCSFVSLASDTTKVHSPKRAALYSAILPGAGQFYNKKYWKMPIVYAGIGVSLYFILDNSKNFRRFRTEYLTRVNGCGIPDSELTNFTTDQVLLITEDYRRWREISYIALGGVYLLQIVDAVVDAHFFDWKKKIGEDLSFGFVPVSFHTGFGLGMRMSLKL